MALAEAGHTLGGAIAALLARTKRRPSRVFLVAAAVVALMAVNPMLAADQALTVVALEVEHSAVTVDVGFDPACPPEHAVGRWLCHVLAMLAEYESGV